MNAMERIWRRLQLVIGRGRATVVDDSKAVQLIQVKLGADGTADGLPRLAEYGFTSNPPLGTDVLVVFIAGERTNGCVLGTNNQQFRMRNLAAGEAAIYDNLGRYVILSAAGIKVEGNASPIVVATTSDVTATAGGNIALTAGAKITLNAPLIEIDATTLTVIADTNITGDVAIAGTVTNNGLDIGVTHTHLPGLFKANTTVITGTSGTVAT